MRTKFHFFIIISIENTGKLYDIWTYAGRKRTLIRVICANLRAVIGNDLIFFPFLIQKKVLICGKPSQKKVLIYGKRSSMVG